MEGLLIEVKWKISLFNSSLKEIKYFYPGDGNKYFYSAEIKKNLAIG
jgi:hypothetical protein